MDLGSLFCGESRSLQPEPRLAELIEHWVAGTGASYRRPVELLIDLAGLVYCDANRLSQWPTHLLTNALVPGAPGAPVQVHASIDKGSFVLSV